jgi:hypothetical protein
MGKCTYRIGQDFSGSSTYNTTLGVYETGQLTTRMGMETEFEDCNPGTSFYRFYVFISDLVILSTILLICYGTGTGIYLQFKVSTGMHWALNNTLF